MTSPYHSRYSEETLTLIEKCIADLKLTTVQKKTILDDLKRGKPIPDLVAPLKVPPSRRVDKKPQFQLKKRGRKRKIETIIQRGAYDIPVYVPDDKIVDREKEKQRLQDILYGLDQIPEEEIKHAGDTNCKNKQLDGSQKALEYERMNELAQEINDRIEFLRHMEEYGLKKKYDFEISNEIAQKINQLEDLRKRIQ